MVKAEPTTASFSVSPMVGLIFYNTVTFTVFTVTNSVENILCSMFVKLQSDYHTLLPKICPPQMFCEMKVKGLLVSSVSVGATAVSESS